ncbi:(R)-mandelonitrile lyase [Streptomyces liangshanensis]|uniref:Cupin domain-containing protein n=1 Tax=Streptomyces liangshanensis TaxID=2717324 RepID=A0A6G9GT11_9ACTN|nr:cupin domain-containing protein [Streptomyces liangshanensis]QIQ01355.1 cupin domain-containing protein [Streptomyces liangshanensis]
MNVTSNGLETMAGPPEGFAGDVYIDVISKPLPPSRIMGGVVRFTPGAHTAWHSHPLGQTIYATEGVGLVQREGGPVEEIRPGDRVSIEPGENHWHGAAPGCFHTQIAYQAADGTGTHTTWGSHLTKDEYPG